MADKPVSTYQPPATEGFHQPILGAADSLNAFRHSLRTPLNQILGYTEMLMEDVVDKPARALLPDLERIHLIGGQLLALINEGLAPWKLMVGRVDLDTMRFEMRSPLNLIVGYAELCQEIALDLGEKALVPDLQKIVGAAKNLQNAFESPSLKERVERCLQNEQSKHRTRWLMEQPSETPQNEGSILIIDDNEMNRDMLCRRLERYGYATIEAETGPEGVALAQKHKPDLILMDVVLPGDNGYIYLQQIKTDPALIHIPVIMLSALDEMEVTIRCIELGAEDYIPKPFNPVLLKARIESSVIKKRLRDQEKNLLETMHMERERLEQLLSGVLPQAPAERARRGETGIIDETKEATVLLVEVVDFTAMETQLPPAQVASVLTELSMTLNWLSRFNKSDKIRSSHGRFVIATGLLAPNPEQAGTICDIALKLLHIIPLLRVQTKTELSLRMTIASGRLGGSIIGRVSFFYDVWGEAISKAEHLMQLCEPDTILLEGQCQQQLGNAFKLEPVDSAQVTPVWRLLEKQVSTKTAAA